MRAFIATIILAFTALVPSFAQATDSNQASYWETADTTCVKFEGSQNGTEFVTITESVALLVIKGGSVDGGNAVYTNPGPGTYSAPLNAGGNVATVSHWIVCKYKPVVTTTTTILDTTTTSTTSVPVTTVGSTVPESTTTVPAQTTTTIADSTTTSSSQPAVTTTSFTATPTTLTVAVGTAPVPTTTLSRTLPSTGAEDIPIYSALIGLGLLGLGATALGLTRRKV